MRPPEEFQQTEQEMHHPDIPEGPLPHELADMGPAPAARPNRQRMVFKITALSLALAGLVAGLVVFLVYGGSGGGSPSTGSSSGSPIAPFVAIFPGIIGSFVAIFASRRQQRQQVAPATKGLLVLTLLAGAMALAGVLAFVMFSKSHP